MQNWFLPILATIFTLSSFAQSKISADLHYLQGFQSHTLQLWNTPIENYKAPGWAAHAFYSYGFKKSKIDISLGIGAQQFYLSANSLNEKFSGSTTRLDIILQGFYNFNAKWKAGIGFNLENNHDFDDFRVKATDLWRYSFLIDFAYSLSERFGLFVRSYNIISPNEDVFLLKNPAYKVGLGVNYKILGK